MFHRPRITSILPAAVAGLLQAAAMASTPVRLAREALQTPDPSRGRRAGRKAKRAAWASERTRERREATARRRRVRSALAVSSPLQPVINSMTNWQRNQWSRYVAGRGSARQDLGIARKFAALERPKNR